MFNEQFFIIFEDVDLSWRMKECRWSSWLIPQSLIYHIRGVSGGPERGFVGFHAFKNKLYMKLKYYPIDWFDCVRIPIKALKLSFQSIKYKLFFTLWFFLFDALKHRVRHRRKDKELYDKWISL